MRFPQRSGRLRSLVPAILTCLGLVWSVALIAQQPRSAVILAVTGAGGLFASSNGGATWQPILTGSAIPGPATYSAVAVDPVDSGVLFVARAAAGPGKSGGPRTTMHRKLYRSTDGGATWSATELPSDIIRQLVIDPSRRNILYLGGEQGLYRSTDSGQTWALAATGATRGGFVFRGMTLDPNQPGVVYATLATGLMKTADYGATWSTIVQVLGPSFPASNFLTGITVDPQRSTTLYIGGQGSCIQAGVAQDCGLFRSSDTGKTWERVPIQGTVAGVTSDPRNGMIYASGRILPSNSANEAGRAMFHKSADGGKTWTSIAVEPGAKSDLDVSLDPVSPNTLYLRVTTIVSNPNEILSPVFYMSTDQGQTWTKRQVAAADVGASDSVSALAATAGQLPVNAASHVSAASFLPGPIAPGEIVTALGAALATKTEASSTSPTFTLGGSRITVTDAAGHKLPAHLFFASPNQINYLVPLDAGLGVASVSIERDGAEHLVQQVQIAELAPGVFTLNSTSLIAAGVLRVSGSVQSVEDIYSIEGSNLVARPIDLRSSTDQVYLLIYGTGLRAAGTSRTSVTIGGENADVLFSGPQGSFAGLDQINVRVPPGLAGKGKVDVRVTINGSLANTTNFAIR